MNIFEIIKKQRQLKDFLLKTVTMKHATIDTYSLIIKSN